MGNDIPPIEYKNGLIHDAMDDDEKNIKCQVSLEKYMACGLGACLSCSCSGIGKRLKVCTDGPVFWAEEVGEW